MLFRQIRSLFLAELRSLAPVDDVSWHGLHNSLDTGICSSSDLIYPPLDVISTHGLLLSGTRHEQGLWHPVRILKEILRLFPSGSGLKDGAGLWLISVPGELEVSTLRS